MRSDAERLADILEAIERIEKYARAGRQRFEEDELIQTWMVHNLEIIGEACRAISEQLKQSHPEVPWAEITGMRNILAHHYFEIDTDVVWAVVERDLPELKRKVQSILSSLDE